MTSAAPVQVLGTEQDPEYPPVGTLLQADH